MPLFLASTSPRRADLLKQIAQTFTQTEVTIDETPYQHENALHYVERMAQEKAKQGFIQLEQQQAYVLSADTIIELDGEILGKPKDQADSFSMLKRLSNRSHWVHTAICLVSQDVQQSCVVSSKVEFRALTDEEIKLYWQTGEPCDKAGSYAIQGLAGSFVQRIEGSYSAIVGLPLAETLLMLRQQAL